MARRTKKSPGPDVPTLLNGSDNNGAELLSQQFQQDSNGMYFPTMTAAKAAAYTIFTSPANDDTMPATPEQDRAVVQRIVAAIKNTINALDRKATYKKCLVPGTQLSYLDWAIHLCAWNILDIAKTIHLTGFKASIYDITLLMQIGETADWTFEQRINMVCKLLERSKAVVASVMKKEKLYTYIGAPHATCEHSKTNNKNNAARAALYQAGHAARKQQSTQPSGQASDSPSASPSRPTPDPSQLDDDIQDEVVDQVQTNDSKEVEPADQEHNMQGQDRSDNDKDEDQTFTHEHTLHEVNDPTNDEDVTMDDADAHITTEDIQKALPNAAYTSLAGSDMANSPLLDDMGAQLLRGTHPALRR
ncbi:hypothetical protein BKA63DRAFT_571583 [Paraphoma chrysanthemicola]|nr:hypothetical protein BKA63DRAFT_571583 [Paraphoma chrysanthemicola]